MLEDMDRKTISMAKFAKNPEMVARDIESSGAVYCITRPRGSTVVMMNEDAFESFQFELQLARDPKLREQLEQSRRDAAAGHGRSLDEVGTELGLDRPAPTSRHRPAPRAARAGRAKGVRRASRAGGRSA
jgi:PHD/YefM family antitoxin component YafN of YafNO toxin-antitoxin module